jgi:hypothetical protein
VKPEPPFKAEILEDGRRLRVWIGNLAHEIQMDRPQGQTTAQELKEEVVQVLAFTRGLLFERVVEVELEAAKAVNHTSAVAPPAFAEFLISYLAPKDSAQAFLGDLQEIFQKNAGRFGEGQARRKYWIQVAISFGPLVWQWLKRVGFFTVLIDYFRAKFGL